MKRQIIAGIVTAAILFPLFGYVYVRGMADGVSRYQKSRQFELTLRSVYLFGVKDGCTVAGWCALVLEEPKK